MQLKGRVRVAPSSRLTRLSLHVALVVPHPPDEWHRQITSASALPQIPAALCAVRAGFHFSFSLADDGCSHDSRVICTLLRC